MEVELITNNSNASRYSVSREVISRVISPFDNPYRFTPTIDSGLSGTNIDLLSGSSSIEVINERSVLGQYKTEPALTNETLEEKLFNAKLACKMAASLYTNKILNWRSNLFSQIDYLMDIEDWEDEDVPVSLTSFKTLLRLMTLKDIGRRPGLGATYSGNAIASWVSENGDRVIVTCLEDDMVEWVVSVNSNGGVDTASGRNKLSNFFERISGHVDKCWFSAT